MVCKHQHTSTDVDITASTAPCGSLPPLHLAASNSTASGGQGLTPHPICADYHELECTLLS